MKKIDTFEPLGQRFKNGTLQFLQDIPKEIGQAIIQSVFSLDPASTTMVVLYGCVNSGAGSTYNISEGIVYYNGEIFRVPAASFTVTTGTAVAKKVRTATTSATHSPVILTDGSSVNAHFVETIVISEDTSGSGLSDFADFDYASTFGKWFNVGDAGAPSFENSWVNHTVATYGKLRFTKDSMGFVTIEGAVKSGTVGSTTPIFHLPSTHRPSVERVFICASFNAGTVTGAFVRVTVYSDGKVSVLADTAADYIGDNSIISLSGIRFKVD